MGRAKTNRNMITRFKIFEKHEDIDPYGEEDWDGCPQYEIGDKLICKRYCGSNHDGWITPGKTYKIESKHGEYMYVIRDDNSSKLFFNASLLDKYFKRKIDEGVHSDIDPYGEEDWSEVNSIDLIPIDRNSIINIGDVIYYHYRRNGNPIVMGEVINIVKSPFDGDKCYVLQRGGDTNNRWHRQLMGCGAQIKD
jgi:hypothetical protein